MRCSLLLDRSIELPLRFGGRRLPEGCYCYVGSTRGPGGIRGRCARHLRGTATRHWHVDWLIAGAVDRRVMAFPGESECELFDRLLRMAEVSVPVPGFGSTECRRCPSHLLAVDRRSLCHFANASVSARQDRGTADGDPLWRC